MPVEFRRNDPLRGTIVEKRIGDALRSGWPELGNRLVFWLRRKSAVGSSAARWQKSHRMKMRGTGLKTQLVIFSNDKLGKYKDQGRGPGKFPPPPNILAYVRFRGLTLAGSKAPIRTQQKSVAFLIGRRLSEKGTKNPPHLYEKIVDENRATIASGIKRLSAEIAGMLSK